MYDLIFMYVIGFGIIFFIFVVGVFFFNMFCMSCLFVFYWYVNEVMKLRRDYIVLNDIKIYGVWYFSGILYGKRFRDVRRYWKVRIMIFWIFNWVVLFVIVLICFRKWIWVYWILVEFYCRIGILFLEC